MDKNLKIKIIVAIICTCILSASILIGSRMITQSIWDLEGAVSLIETNDGQDTLDSSTFENVMQNVIDTIKDTPKN